MLQVHELSAVKGHSLRFKYSATMAVATGPVWFQLYVFKDRAISASLVTFSHT